MIPLLVLAGCTPNSAHPARAGSLQAAQISAGQHLSPEGEAALRGWIEAGSLPDLRWPDFSDYRVHVKNFYAPAGYVLGWVRGGQPTPQAQAILMDGIGHLPMVEAPHQVANDYLAFRASLHAE